MQKLSETTTTTTTTEELTAKNRRLSDRFEEIEQYQRSLNTEIKGVPETRDAYVIARSIGTFVKESIWDSDIDVCHQVPTFKPLEKNILLRFVERTKQNKTEQKCKKKKN